MNLVLRPSTSLKLWQSKVGGEPYLPLEERYPRSHSGTPLTLLAQINFSEMPPLPGYPSEGILQFYIDGNDEMLGFDREHRTKQDGSRVLYFPTVHEDESKLRADTGKYQGRSDSFPLEGDSNYSIEFIPGKQYITYKDYRFYDKMPLIRDEDELIDLYINDVSRDDGHRMGGYPNFAQGDPREDSRELEEYELLFQLDSGYDDQSKGVDIMWGDAGVGGFFIRPQDLENRVFTDVMYNWDCS